MGACFHIFVLVSLLGLSSQCGVSEMTLQFCHSGLDLACPAPNAGESSLFNLDSRFCGNDSPEIIVKKC